MKTDCQLLWDPIREVYKTNCEVDGSIIDLFVSTDRLHDAQDFTMLPSYMDVEVTVSPDCIKDDSLVVSFCTGVDVPKQWLINEEIREKNKGLIGPYSKEDSKNTPKVQFSINLKREEVEIIEYEKINISISLGKSPLFYGDFFVEIIDKIYK